jgi:two-component system response regulator MtrA
MDTSKRILVIDDDIYMVEMIKEILQAEGFQITTLLDASEFIKNFSAYKVDLILLDIRMRDVNGLQVLQFIRQKSDIPVIMLTGISDIQTIHNSIEIGADDYVKKPFYPKELIARIKAKLRRYEIS